MATEREVRTRAGWLGVEISRSRVRTPGRAGFGLYRVRGARLEPTRVVRNGEIADIGPHWEPTEWTAYAFTLDAIWLAVENSIQGGVPAGPVSLHVQRDGWRPGDGDPYVVVPTHWTSAYGGRRDLGVSSPGPAKIREKVTVRSRQREQNAAFQAGHQVRREHGLKARHARKLGEGG